MGDVSEGEMADLMGEDELERPRAEDGGSAAIGVRQLDVERLPQGAAPPQRAEFDAEHADTVVERQRPRAALRGFVGWRSPSGHHELRRGVRQVVRGVVDDDQAALVERQGERGVQPGPERANMYVSDPN